MKIDKQLILEYLSYGMNKKKQEHEGLKINVDKRLLKKNDTSSSSSSSSSSSAVPIGVGLLGSAAVAAATLN